MTLPEDLPHPEEPSKSGREFPADESILPEGFTPLEEPFNLPARRRRRSRRYFVSPDDDERSALLEKLARRAFPSFEFFLFSLLCGAVLGAGFILDSQALLLLGILLAPLMTPWVGMVLGAMTGAWRFFFQTLIALLTACLLVFLTGTLAGMAARLWPNLLLIQASIQSHLWWENFIVLALGAALLVYSFTRSEDKPLLPSVMVAYGLLLPLSAGGFGLGSGTAPVWPDGLLVFLVHLALITLLGGIVLAALRFRPAGSFGTVLTVIVGLLSLAALVVFTGLGNLILGSGPGAAQRTSTPTAMALVLPSITPGIQTSTLSAALPTVPPAASPTETLTPTPEPTPSYAIIESAVGGGALVRAEPGTGAPVATLLNGILVEVLPDVRNVGGFDWAHVRTSDGIDGWVLGSVLTPATPAPTQAPTIALPSPTS